MTVFYQAALDALEVSDSEAFKHWDRIASLLADITILRPTYHSSDRTLLDNIKSEWRLTDRVNGPSPSALTDFMFRCVDGLASKTENVDEFLDTFQSICTDFSLHGPPINTSHPDIPDDSKSVRYVDKYAFETALKRMLSKVDRVRLAKYQRIRDPDSLQLQEMFKQMAFHWNPAHFSPGDTIANPSNKSVFATFVSCIDPSWDAKTVAAHLALPCFFDPCRKLFRLTYLTASATDPRCPTFADAGTYPYYCGIQEPSGQEQRLDPDTYKAPGKTSSKATPALPVVEYVHRNASMQILDGPVEYIGEL